MSPPTPSRQPTGRRAVPRRVLALLVLVAVGTGVLAACSAPAAETRTAVGRPAPIASPSTTAAPGSMPESVPTTEADVPPEVVGAIVRFSGGGRVIDVTLQEDNPTTRDLLSRLPTTIRLEEFAGREKVGYLSPGLTVEGSPGSDPEDGDLIYFAPWGNIGFYYDAAGIEYSDDTVHLGSYDATPAELADFDGADVTMEVVR
jgi:hypothetical protein